jgi:hypothetical protein
LNRKVYSSIKTLLPSIMLKTALFTYNRFAAGTATKNPLLKNRILAASGLAMRTNHTFTYSNSDLGEKYSQKVPIMRSILSEAVICYFVASLAI